MHLNKTTETGKESELNFRSFESTRVEEKDDNFIEELMALTILRKVKLVES